jgi:hypothetical protein
MKRASDERARLVIGPLSAHAPQWSGEGYFRPENPEYEDMLPQQRLQGQVSRLARLAKNLPRHTGFGVENLPIETLKGHKAAAIDHILTAPLKLYCICVMEGVSQDDIMGHWATITESLNSLEAKVDAVRRMGSSMGIKPDDYFYRRLPQGWQGEYDCELRHWMGPGWESSCTYFSRVNELLGSGLARQLCYCPAGHVTIGEFIQSSYPGIYEVVTEFQKLFA